MATNLIVGLSNYNASRAELEAALMEELRGASPQVLVKVAEVLAGGLTKAIEAKVKPKATLKVDPKGVTVAKLSKLSGPPRLDNGVGPGAVTEALKLCREGSPAEVLGHIDPKVLSKVPSPMRWVRGHLQEGVKRGDFERVGRGLYRVVRKVAKAVPPKAVGASSGGDSGLTLLDVWKVMRKSKVLTPVQMAVKLDCKPRQLGAILGRLAQRGWVARSEKDGAWKVTALGMREG